MNAYPLYVQRFIRIMLLFYVVLLGACSTVPENLGRDSVAQLAKERGVSPAEDESVDVIASLLDKPLNIKAAVQIVLLNNPNLRQSYTQLGIGAADLYEAGRVRNPVLSISVLNSNQSGELDRQTFGLITSFTDLITLSARKKFAEKEFLAIKQDIASRVLATAMATEAAYYRFVAAKQTVILRRQKSHAADLSLKLAKRYHQAGNFTLYELAIERSNASQAQLDLLSAEAESYAERVVLAELLGVSVGDPWSVPEHLPLPMADSVEIKMLLNQARENRLDLAAARTRADNLASKLGVVNWNRWLGELDIGIEHERESDGVRLTGPLLDWELPLFTQHRDAFLRADAQLQQAVINVARLSLAVDNEVRLADAAMRNAYTRAQEYRDKLIPARRNAVARAQEQEAFMLIGIFELLNTKQEEYNSYQGYSDAVRDYWLARVALSRAVGNTLAGPASDHPVMDITTLLTPISNDGHAMHGVKKNHQMEHMNHSEQPMEAPMHEPMHKAPETMPAEPAGHHH